MIARLHDQSLNTTYDKCCSICIMYLHCVLGVKWNWWCPLRFIQSDENQLELLDHLSLLELPGPESDQRQRGNWPHIGQWYFYSTLTCHSLLQRFLSHSSELGQHYNWDAFKFQIINPYLLLVCQLAPIPILAQSPWLCSCIWARRLSVWWLCTGWTAIRLPINSVHFLGLIFINALFIYSLPFPSDYCTHL